jgi:tetratricopeptide (TPR) repeat protein
MEQMTAIQQRIGEYVLKISKPPRIPAQQPGGAGGNAEGFYSAWEEACKAQYDGEPRRAHYYYHQALKAAPEDIEPEALADILDSLKEVNRTLAQDEEKVWDLQAAVEGHPDNAEKRFRYASLLWKVGREEEAVKEYETVLEHPETLCRECIRDCCNNIGWALYRKGAYARALNWFERAAKVKSVDAAGDMIESTLPLENIIQVYVALNLVNEAIKATVDYVSRFGRLPWPERHALRKLNIDADAIYVQQCGHAA